jgi:hypothetical protein
VGLISNIDNLPWFGEKLSVGMGPEVMNETISNGQPEVYLAMRHTIGLNKHPMIKI